MSPRLLAAIIRHTKGWNGQNIRLLSCSTGQRVEGDYCFAEELANALGVKVKAPNDVLYIVENGEIYVGLFYSRKGHLKRLVQIKGGVKSETFWLFHWTSV